MMGYGGSDAVWGPGHGCEKTYSFLLGLWAYSFLVPKPRSTSICKRSTTILRPLGHTQAWGDHVEAMRIDRPLASPQLFKSSRLVSWKGCGGHENLPLWSPTAEIITDWQLQLLCFEIHPHVCWRSCFPQVSLSWLQHGRDTEAVLFLGDVKLLWEVTCSGTPLKHY